jgi:hypothetical protein
MSMEKMSGQESGVEQKEKEPKKKLWGKLQTLALGASLLANGGFIGEKIGHKIEVDHLKKGDEKTFSIDQRSTVPGYAGGERGDFSLQKNNSGGWTLVGRVAHYEQPSEDKNNYVVHPDYEVRYELPRLTPEAADAIFNDLEATVKTDGLSGGARNGGVHEFMAQLIESADKGTIVEYDPNSNEPKSNLELDSAKEALTQTSFVGEDGGTGPIEVSNTLSLHDFENSPEFKQ